MPDEHTHKPNTPTKTQKKTTRICARSLSLHTTASAQAHPLGKTRKTKDSLDIQCMQLCVRVCVWIFGVLVWVWVWDLGLG